mgnify:FL=1
MKNIKLWFITGFIFTAVFGTLSHFFYDWSGENVLIGLISPVNESTWEHMKLAFFPVLIWSFFIPAQIRDKVPALRPALLLGGLVGTLFVPVLFYTYSGILGQNIAWMDIAIFFVSVFLTFVCAWILRRSERIYQKRTAIYILTVLFLIFFFLFTFLPPEIGLFADPLAVPVP